MSMSKAAEAAVKAITKLRPDVKDTYKQQRMAEDAAARLSIHDPRCRIEDSTVEAPAGYAIPIRIFTPLDIDVSLKGGIHAHEDSRGTILFFHGGGFANGDIDFYTDACARTAIRLERRVVSVDYRRSPEHRFPAAVEDGYAVARALFASDVLPDVAPDNIVLMGDSAGGNIAAVVSLMARERSDFKPRTQVLLYPLTYDDHSLTTMFDSVRDNGEGYILTRETIVEYVEMYLEKPEDYHDPHFAPLIAESLADMPRTLVITAEYDPLRDEGEAYAARVQDDGGEAALFRMLGGVHGYFLYPSVLSLVRDTYSIIKHFLDGDALAHEDESDPKWLEILHIG